MPSAAIIGAGLSGIGAANTLQAAGCRVVVFEKSRGWGGRCATKRWGAHVVDHGAQYFTMREPAFRNLVITACGESLCLLKAPILTECGAEIHGEERFYLREGNSRLVRMLGAGLEVRTGLCVESVQGSIDGEIFDLAISSAPWPQTCQLAGLPPPINCYAPCLTGLYLYRGSWPGITATAYAISDRSGAALAWSACENHKEGRVDGGFTVLVVQASEAFSRQHLESDANVWGEILRGLLEERWVIDGSDFVAMLTHRWRFARKVGEVCVPELPQRTFFTGDGLSESRVEAAYLSGVATAEKILSI